MNSTTAAIGITDNFLCLDDDFNLTLSGSFSSQEANLFSFQVDYCLQDYLDWKYPGMNVSCQP